MSDQPYNAYEAHGKLASGAATPNPDGVTVDRPCELADAAACASTRPLGRSSCGTPAAEPPSDGAEVTRYRTIVADPPWHYDGFGAFVPDADAVPHRANSGKWGSFDRRAMPYPTLTLAEINQLPWVASRTSQTG